MQLNPKALATATAIFLALIWLVVMGFSLLTGVGKTTVNTLGGMHPYYGYSWGGLIVIVIEHLICGYVLGWVFAKLYNKYLK